VFRLSIIGITLLYPLAIWLGHERLEPRFLSGLLFLVALTRLPALKLSQTWCWWLAGILLLPTLALWNNVLLPLKLYPVLVNGALLGVFAYSLFFPPTMAERFARMGEADLHPLAVGYTRRVTQVWCGFFALNGAIALVTALWASLAIWSLYNGFIAYLLMGLLFAGEYCIRRQFQRRHHG
jgi:uncharacterized membrane protein